MAEEKKFPSVSEAEKQEKGVTALADRPNLAATYGQGGLTAAELKKWFDGLASLIIDKYNLLGAEMQSGAATEYIGVPKDAAFPEGTASTLKDVLAGIVSGALAQYLVAYAKEGADGGAGTKVSLQSFVLDALKRIGTAESDIDALESRATSLEGSVGDDTTEGTVKGRVKSLEGRMHTAEGDIDSLEIKMTTAEGDIDNLEKRASRVEDRATALESRASDFDSSFIVTDGRLTALEGRASTAESNISYIKGKLASFGLLQNVVFDESTDKLTFTFVVGDSTKKITISLADFIDSAELSSQISEKVSALAKDYVDQAKASASNASASKTAAKAAQTAAESAAKKAEGHATAASASASAAEAARESAMREASTAGSMAMDASSYATQAKASADKAEMYSQTSEDRWSVFDKRLTNVENGISADPFVTDDTIAYQKTVPERALPFAALERVGGMSYKSHNLAKTANGTYRIGNGELVYIDYQDGIAKIIMNEFRGERSSLLSMDYTRTALQAGTYTFSYEIDSLVSGMSLSIYLRDMDAEVNLFSKGTTSEKTGKHTFTIDKDTVFAWGFYIYNPASADESDYKTETKTFKVMINKGETVMPFEPYFEGIRHAAVTEIESESANLSRTQNGIYPLGTTGQVQCEFADGVAKVVFNGFVGDISSTLMRPYTRILLPAGTYTFVWDYKSGPCNASLYYINESTGETIFNKGVAPKEVNTKTFTLSTSATVSWSCYFYNGTASAPVSGESVFEMMLVRGSTALPFAPYRKDTFPIPEAVQALDGYGLGISEDVHNYIDYGNAEYVQMCSERAYRSGDENNPEVVTDGTRTVYALTTLVRTPITFTDNYIRVGGSGTLTFVNEHKLAVPSTVLYLTKEASV